MQCQVTPRPPRVGAAMVAISLTDASARPVTRAHVELEGDMSHPGMEPVFGSTTEAEPGRYMGHLELTMAGDWVILVHITLADGQKLERQVEVSGVQPN